eukprot:TRINITY_DN91559_c0_g1_i1.p1 TRINITY_DN91559_c0_g1~~TRINITY_DN91559_c0_g1_i1.p1  ORF type:complete len:1223 (+),score=327.32 TRINITY_DN91559_c0_g1_i1:58-3726(+)
MGNGASSANKAEKSEAGTAAPAAAATPAAAPVSPAPEPAKTPAAPAKAAEAEVPRPTTPKPSDTKPPPPPPKADAVSSASKSIGGPPPKTKKPSPEDDVLFDQWEKDGKLVVFKGVACTVPYSVSAVLEKADGTSVSKEDVQREVDKALTLAEKTFSHFVADSEVTAINKMSSHDAAVAVSKELASVLDMGDALFRMTRGIFDVGLLPLFRNLDGAAVKDVFLRQVSKDQHVEDPNWATGFEYMGKDGVKMIKKKVSHAALDVCGLAKGFTVDMITEALRSLGVTSCFVDWGGDVKVLGKHPAGRRWTVLVQEPPGTDLVKKEGAYIGSFELRCGEALATSGDYAKTCTSGELLCTPIVISKQKALVQVCESGVSSATIVSRSCMVADALATCCIASEAPAKVRELVTPFLVPFNGPVPVDCILDYLIYTREGPRVIRRPHWQRTTEDGDEKRFKTTKEVEPHVVVIGGGLAGLSAVIEAQKAGARVTIIEKEANLGGNSAKATSGINGWGTHTQFAQKVSDEGKFFERDTFKSALGGNAHPQLIQTLSEQSGTAVNWLIDELGVPLTVLSQLGGHSSKRTHRAPPLEDGTPVPIGYLIMKHAEAYVRSLERTEVKCDCSLLRLLSEDADDGGMFTTSEGRRKICGVEIKMKDSESSEEIKCDSVVLCTGGFAFDDKTGGLMQAHRPDLVGVATTCGAFSTGDGMKVASAAGANLVDMDKVQLHPTGFIDPKDPTAHTKYLGPEALRGSGGILLNQKGERFVDELQLRSVVSQAILSNCEPYVLPDGSKDRPFAYCILNAPAQRLFGPPQLRFYKDQQGLFEPAEDIPAVAQMIGCSEETVRSSLAAYAQACENSYCTTTGKSVFPCRVSAEDTGFLVARVTPVIHYCMGGVQINCAGEVQQAAGGSFSKKCTLRGLYAAGEVTGGVHGENRLGGNSLLDCVVFGRIAGQRAATGTQKESACLNPTEWKPVILRELRRTGPTTAVYRFNLDGVSQKTGVPLGHYIAIRGNLDGDQLTGYYSPVSRPDDHGQIDILARTDAKGGPITAFLTQLKPGGEAQMKAMDGPDLHYHQETKTLTYKGRTIRKISLLAGGTGLAPMIQLTRQYFRELGDRKINPKEEGLRLIYAAEEESDLAFSDHLDQVAKTNKEAFKMHMVLNKPPVGWTQGIGFVTPQVLKEHAWFPPADDHFVLICGPPIFEKIMCGNLAKLGFARDYYYSFAEA